MIRMVPAALLADRRRLRNQHRSGISRGGTVIDASTPCRFSASSREVRSSSRQLRWARAGRNDPGKALSHSRKFGLWAVVVVLAPLLCSRGRCSSGRRRSKRRTWSSRIASRSSRRSRTRWRRSAPTNDSRSPATSTTTSRRCSSASRSRSTSRASSSTRADLDELTTQLEKIRDSKQETSDRIRALIRDLHRSPLGANGLAEALESFTDEVGRDSGDPLPSRRPGHPAARADRAAGLPHRAGGRDERAEACDSRPTSGSPFARGRRHRARAPRQRRRASTRRAPGPEGHFGMAMMRERAQVGGGTFEVESAPGEGATASRFGSRPRCSSPRRCLPRLRSDRQPPRRRIGASPGITWSLPGQGRRSASKRPSITSTTKLATPT